MDSTELLERPQPPQHRPEGQNRSDHPSQLDAESTNPADMLKAAQIKALQQALRQAETGSNSDAAQSGNPTEALQALAQEEDPQDEIVDDEPQPEREMTLKEMLKAEAKRLRSNAWVDLNGCFGRGGRGSLKDFRASMRDYQKAVSADWATKFGKYEPLINNLNKEQSRVEQVIANAENQLEQLRSQIEEAEFQMQGETMIDAKEEEIQTLLKGDEGERERGQRLLERNKLKKEESLLRDRKDRFGKRKGEISTVLDRWSAES